MREDIQPVRHTSVNIFDLIDSLCAEFRADWKRGQRPRIEEFLGNVPAQARANLFRNLLQLEIRYRHQANESPEPAEYHRRFPDLGQYVRQAFDETTLTSLDAVKDTSIGAVTYTRDISADASHSAPVASGPPAASRLGDYELIRELGRGGFGVVYEARHIHRQDRVALKTLPTGIDDHPHSLINAERLHKFRQEFRAVTEVNHPHLVGMQTLEVDSGQWFLTMDMVEGVDFLQYVRPDGRLDEGRLRATLGQLLNGIHALHELGIVHRDLKPSNVMVDDHGSVTILDFGLVADLQQPTDPTVSAQSHHFAGTPRYAAPEQINGVRTSAIDWYAMGVMLYEALTGKAPFIGTAVEILLKKQGEDAPPLSQVDGLPPDLARLVDQLLRRDAQQRPAADAIAQALSITLVSRSHDSADRGQMTAASHADGLLIGRESQLAELEQARENLLSRRQPIVVFISGRSGEGKTLLAEKFLAPLRRDREMLVLSGRCYDRESVPFKALDSLIDALVEFLRSMSTDELLRVLPDDIQMLAQLFPVLRRVGEIADRGVVQVAGVDARQVRYRAFAALRELMITVSKQRPIVLFIDDLQWGDGDSAIALQDLLKPPHAPAVMLLGSFRSDETDESAFLNDWPQWQADADQTIEHVAIDVAPLSEAQCVGLFAARLGIDPGSISQDIRHWMEETRGNPYLLEQLIEGFDQDTGRFEAAPLDQVIDRKLQRLADDATPLLQAIAVAGQAVALSEASAVSHQTRGAFATITHMRSERLVRLIGSGDRHFVDTYHDKIRETVLQKLASAQRTELHRQYGELLEQNEGVTTESVLEHVRQDRPANGVFATTTRIFDLAYHFHAAGDPRGFAYQLMGGEQSFQAYATEDAVEFFKRAEASLPSDVDNTIRYRLWERLGASYARLRSFEQALHYYDLAVQSGPTPLMRAHAQFGIANVHQSQGKYLQTTQNYDQVLGERGSHLPSALRAFFALPSLLFRTFVIPIRWQQARRREDTAWAELGHELYRNLSLHGFEHLSLVRYFHACLRQATSAFRTGRPDLIARGLGVIAPHLAQSGFFRWGRRVLKRSTKFSGEARDVEAEGVYRYCSAITLANSRGLLRARREHQSALPLLVKCGAHLDASMCAHLLRHLQAVIGTATDELEVARTVLSLAEEVGDVRGQFWGHYDMASALGRAGKIDEAKSHIKKAEDTLGNNTMKLSETIFLATAGGVLLQASEYQAACECLDKSWQQTRRRGFFVEYNVRALVWLIEGIAGPNWFDAAPRGGVGRLPGLCRFAAAMYWFFPIIQSPIQRVRGRALWVLGKHRKAVRYFERAVEKATHLGADYDRARSLLDLAAVRSEQSDANRREAIKLLKETESVIPYAERWLLADQYDEHCVAPPPRAVS